MDGIVLASIALLFCPLLGVGHTIPVSIPSLTNSSLLLIGPRPHETGRFIYKTEGSGNTFYCRYCSDRAVTDSTYLYEQQSLCYRVYEETGWDNITPYESENKKYAVCNVGEIPGCGKPPFNITDAMWNCTTGHNGHVHSVYLSCKAECSHNRPFVGAQIYCNESLVWHTDYKHEGACSGPQPSVKEEKDLQLVIVLIAVIAFVVVVAPTVVVWCLCKKKTSPSQQSSEEDIPLSGITSQLANGVAGGTGGRDSEGGGGEEEVDGGVGIGQTQYRSSCASTIGPCSLSASDDDIHQREPADPEEDEKTSLLQDSKDCKVPDVRVFRTNDSHSWQENLGASCRLQQDVYSVPRGSDFFIVPSSPGGILIVEFEVVRKEGEKPYRGRACPELGLDFFHTVQNASDDDAGRFTWHITLENGQHYQRDFTIFISAAEESASNSTASTDEQPDGSVQPTPCVERNVAENNLDFESGEKSAQAEGRPDPEGMEDTTRVPSTATKPPAQTQQAQGLVQQASKQTACPNSVDNSIPHLNPQSFSLNSRGPQIGENVVAQNSNNSHQPQANENVGQDVDNDTNHSAHLRDGQGTCQRNLNNVEAARLRGEMLSTPAGSYDSENTTRLMSGDDLNISSMLTNSTIGEPQTQANDPEHPSSVVQCTLSHLNPASINAPSFRREEPSGVSREIPHVEHARAEQRSPDFNQDHEDEVLVTPRQDDDAHQTHRKQIAEDTDDDCITRLSEVRDLQYLEHLCNLADPRDRLRDLESWYGFGRHYGIENYKLDAIEYHRRGFVHDGPMRYVLKDLGQRGRKVSDLVRYFFNNNRQDIVDLTLYNCPDHRQCRYCIDWCRANRNR